MEADIQVKDTILGDVFIDDKSNPEQAVKDDEKNSQGTKPPVKGGDKNAKSGIAKETEVVQTSGAEDIEKHEKNGGIGENEEEKKDDPEDERKDVEMPLLDDNETVSIDLGHDENNIQGNNTPTLPLPEKKKPLPEVEIKTVEERKGSPPSLFRFPLSRIRYEWKNASSWPQFFGRTICITFATLGWAFFVGGVPLISVAMLIVGSIYINDCPLEPRIPAYLIVSGFFGTLQLVFKIANKLVPEKFQDLVRNQEQKCRLLEGLMQIFLFIWFILGCVWVYSVFEPEYDDPEHREYCNKSVYLFAYWILNLTFIILCGLMIFSFCVILIVASSSDDETNRH